MCRVTACALPYRSRGCDRGVAQGLPLRDAPGFGIASLQLLNLCQDQKEATLVYAIGFSKFDLTVAVNSPDSENLTFLDFKAHIVYGKLTSVTFHL